LQEIVEKAAHVTEIELIQTTISSLSLSKSLRHIIYFYIWFYKQFFSHERFFALILCRGCVSVFCSSKIVEKTAHKTKSQPLISACQNLWYTQGRFHQHLIEAFTCPDPKSAKRQSSQQCLFALLGSEHIKATHKTLCSEIDPWCGWNRSLIYARHTVSFRSLASPSRSWVRRLNPFWPSSHLLPSSWWESLSGL